MARKRLCKVVDLTSVKRRGEAVVAENYVDHGDQLVAVRNATGAIQYEYFDGSSLDQVFRCSSESSGHWTISREQLGM